MTFCPPSTGALYSVPAAASARVSVVVRTERSVHYRGHHSRVDPLLEAMTTVFTRRVVCVCQAVLESRVSRLPWAARRFVTVANGISSAPHTRPREIVRRELGLGETDRVALAVASLTPQKAQHQSGKVFAAAAERVPEATGASAGIAPLEAGPIREDLIRWRREADGRVASARWGSMRVDYTPPRVITLARAPTEGRADVVLGHHPHVKLAFGRYYLERCSPWLDFAILARTVRAVFSSREVY